MNQATQRENNSIGNAEVVTRAEKARDECDQTSELEEINDDASETNEGKRYQEPPSTPPRIMQGTDSLDPESKVSVGKPSGEKQKKKKKLASQVQKEDRRKVSQKEPPHLSTESKRNSKWRIRQLKGRTTQPRAQRW